MTMQDFQTSTFIIIGTFETISKQTMKTMKIWKIDFGQWPSHLMLRKVMHASLSSRLIGAFSMFAAFSLASCSSDDENED